MSFELWVRAELQKNGLSETDSVAVLDIAKEDDAFTSTFKGRWNDDINGYPPMIKSLVWMSLKPIALQWCEDNCPEAWFKPMFMSTEKQKEMGIIN